MAGVAARAEAAAAAALIASAVAWGSVWPGRQGRRSRGRCRGLLPLLQRIVQMGPAPRGAGAPAARLQQQTGSGIASSLGGDPSGWATHMWRHTCARGAGYTQKACITALHAQTNASVRQWGGCCSYSPKGLLSAVGLLSVAAALGPPKDALPALPSGAPKGLLSELSGPPKGLLKLSLKPEN